MMDTTILLVTQVLMLPPAQDTWPESTQAGSLRNGFTDQSKLKTSVTSFITESSTNPTKAPGKESSEQPTELRILTH